ncbi:MAG: LPS export ABC transporter permease LptG [Betaproteobacteria bacterium]|nr:LPS export ABC transporter permease LptG [Betaproteobacteria bacterium]
MNILFRYLARDLVGSIVITGLALLGLFSFFDFINELSDNRPPAYTSTLAILYVTLNSPGRLYELLPLAVIIGALFTWNRLALSSEFSVMRSGGLPTGRMAWWMLVLGAGIGLAALLFGEYVTPNAERLASQIKLRATSGVVAHEFQTGMWAKDKQTFINIRDMRADATLQDVRLYSFDAEFRLLSMRRAESARWEGGHWRLQGLTETRINEQGTQTSRLPDQQWDSAVTPDLLELLMVKPESMSIAALYSYKKHLESNRQDAKRYTIALWNKLVYPVAMPVMLLLALSFAFRPPRSGEAGGRLLTGVMLGLGFHLSSRMMSQMTLLQDWPTGVAAVTPTLLFALAAVGGLWMVDRR